MVFSFVLAIFYEAYIFGILKSLPFAIVISPDYCFLFYILFNPINFSIEENVEVCYIVFYWFVKLHSLFETICL